MKEGKKIMEFKSSCYKLDNLDKALSKIDCIFGSGTFKPMGVAWSTDDKTSKFYSEDMLDFLLEDVMKQKSKELKQKMAKSKEQENKDLVNAFNNIIDKVIFNDPATIIVFKNGEKVIVKCQEGDTYDKEKGLALAIIKFAFGNTSYFNTIFKKWLPEDGE